MPSGFGQRAFLFDGGKQEGMAPRIEFYKKLYGDGLSFGKAYSAPAIAGLLQNFTLYHS